jgi:choline dehydrogenase-like flavoprotein
MPYQASHLIDSQRLSDGGRKVLLLEAGTRGLSPWTHIPVRRRAPALHRETAAHSRGPSLMSSRRRLGTLFASGTRSSTGERRAAAAARLGRGARSLTPLARLFRTQSEEGLNGRSLLYPRGKVVGGCSAINGESPPDMPRAVL